MVLKIGTEEQKNLALNQRTSLEVWEVRVWHALRHLDDRSILNQSPLARLTYIQRLAEKEFHGNSLVGGLALKHALIKCVDKIISDLGDEAGLHKTCEFLRLVKQGFSLSKIGNTLGLSREHVTRVYKKKATRLVAHEFSQLVNTRRRNPGFGLSTDPSHLSRRPH